MTIPVLYLAQNSLFTFYNLLMLLSLFPALSSYDGFESVWNGSLAENVTQCEGKNFSIVMVFTCENTSFWNLVSPNVTQYMTHTVVSGCEVRYYFLLHMCTHASFSHVICCGGLWL